jgi:hypothetical protein
MDTNKICTIAVFLMLMGVLIFSRPVLPPGNQSMHNVEQNEQRNVTPGGSGIPGGTNPYFPTNFPLPSPTARR